MERPKALVVFSGGLDSMLAAKLLMNQDVEVTALTFESNFFDARVAKESAENLGIPIIVKDISEIELGLVKNPPNGYGKYLNPCIDCHAIMIRLAGEIAKEKDFSIVATGEVLGQRGFSQNRDALRRVKEISGVDVLRPLSAKLLAETKVEKERLITRGKLRAIRGRRREEQIELAARYGIKKYPSPAGGCLLTDPEFSERLMKLLDNCPDCSINDIELIKNGRIFWLRIKEGGLALAIIGRNHEENERLKKLAKKGDFIVELKEINGPSTLLRFIDIKEPVTIKSNSYMQIPKILSLSKLRFSEPKNLEQIIDIICLLTGYHSTKARNKEVELIINKIS